MSFWYEMLRLPEIHVETLITKTTIKGNLCCGFVSSSAVSCVVSEWTGWSGCAEPCRATVRRRSRTILQEPLNAGESCPHLEEHAGCAEYWSQQGHCHNSLGEEKKKSTLILPNLPILSYAIIIQSSLHSLKSERFCWKLKVILWKKRDRPKLLLCQTCLFCVCVAASEVNCNFLIHQCQKRSAFCC